MTGALRWRPFAELAPTLSQSGGAPSFSRSLDDAAIERAEIQSGPAPAEAAGTVITEDLPGAWVEGMLFNPGSDVHAWSELDALRDSEAKNPPRSPHPIRLREYGPRGRSARRPEGRGAQIQRMP